MNLEQVKEHFKYAKEVRCLADGNVFNLKEISSKGIFRISDGFWFDDKKANDGCKLYKSNTNQLAEILTYIFERGEEVEVKDTNDTLWSKAKFISFSFKNKPIVEYSDGLVLRWEEIRKLTPESKLESQLSELKKVAEANGMSLEIIFKQK